MSWFREFCSEVGEAVGTVGGLAAGVLVGGAAVLGKGAVGMVEGKSFEEATSGCSEVFESCVTTCAAGGGGLGKSVGQYAPEVAGAIALAVTADHFRQQAEQDGVADLPSRTRNLVDSARCGANLAGAASEFIAGS